ncbi:MAG: leucine-rich repeat domain-containing protein [Gammaproteobacteria bacterium]|nr:leucine-rich repeat domain-containing protein [Gammaproteobacteria bacterium]MDE0412856.1 leucine-rich repeat domain-containing protein [Gammaproteobacteria bacterium]
MTERLFTPFNSIGVLMMAGFLMQAGHSQTLPEQLSAEAVMSFARANNIQSAAELIESLPPLHKRHATMVFDSRALNKELVSKTHPRVISFGADARFILSWATHPDAPDNVEFLQPLADRWDAGVIDFSGEEPELSRPEVCSTCHGHMKRPIWGDYNEWRGTIDDKELELSERSQILSDLEASSNPRFSPMEISDRFFPQTVSTATGNRSGMWNFAAEFGSMLALRHAEVLFNRIQMQDDFAESAEQIICGELSSGDRLVPQEDYYLAIMHSGDQLVVVQEDTDELPHAQKGFSSGNANIHYSLNFLILHDFWKRDSRVSDYYARLGNEEVSPLFSSYLNYLPGTATAEQELRASYDQHFVLKGQASLNARIDKETRRRGPAHDSPYSIAKTAVFGEGHFKSMAPRVCNIVRAAPNQRLSQLRIADGKASEDAGKITLTVNLDPVRSETVSVGWFSWEPSKEWYAPKVADRDDDFVYSRGTLTFNAGAARKNLTVKIVDDGVDEPPEYFNVQLEQASGNALIADGLAWATIEGELSPIKAEGPTARFDNAPLTHDGIRAFTVQLRFSEEVALSDDAFTDGLVTVTGGTVGQAGRVTEGSTIAWEITVTPGGEGDVVITLPAPKDRACDEQPTVCTSDGRKLLQATTVTVRGPPVGPPASAAPSTPTEPPTPVTQPSGDDTGEDDETAVPVDDADDESAETGAVSNVDDGSNPDSMTPPAEAAAWGERLPGRDIQLPSGSNPSGLWSDGETMWVISDWGAGKVTTYSLADGSALGAGEVTLDDGATAAHQFLLQGDGYPAGLWSDGATLWVADIASSVYAYRLSDGVRQTDRDVPQTVLAAAGNLAPTGLWSDGETLWVADILAGKVFAYRLSDKVRAPEKEFDLSSADSHRPSPWGLWSDGETALVTLFYDGGVQGYALSGGAPMADRALDSSVTGSSPLGLWSDRETLWVVNQGDQQIRAYAVPGLRAAAARTASSVADPFSVRVVTRVDAVPGIVDAGPPVFIADAALRGAIAEALGLNSDQSVGLEAMARIRSLNVRGAGIAELTGLEYAVNLESLDLGHNPVRDPWTLAMLPRLTVLNLDGAAIDLYSLSALVGLERLSLRNNGLTDVSALAGLVNLRHLSLRGNALSDLWPLAGLAQLEILDVRGVTVPDHAPLSGLYKLRHLDLTDTKRRTD